MDTQTAVEKTRAAVIKAAEREAKREAAKAGFGGRRLVKTSRAAIFMDVSERTLECWRQKSGGPRYIRLAPTGARAVRAIRYRIADLERWIADREVASTSDPGPCAGGSDAHPS